MRRFVTLLVVSCTIGWLPNGAAAADGATEGAARAIPSVALYGVNEPSYVLCPVSARSRADCPIDAGVSGSRAIDGLRADASRAGVQRVVLFLTGFRTNFAAGRIAGQRVQDVLGCLFCSCMSTGVRTVRLPDIVPMVRRHEGKHRRLQRSS